MKRAESKRLPPLTALRTFEVVARHQQLRPAAEELFVTPSAVSRQIKLLEDHLGVDLFRRDKRAIELTDTGKLYAADLRRVFDDLHSATEKVIARHERNVLHIRTSMMSFTQRWLMPRLFQFQEQYPLLDIQLTSCSDISEIDFDRNPVDIGLSRHRLTEDNLASEALMPELLVVVCSPGLHKKKPIKTLDSLAAHRLITTTSRPDIWPAYFKAEKAHGKAASKAKAKPGGELQLAHFFMALEAAISGVGVAALPLPLVADDLRLGRLVAPLGCALPSGESYYAVYRKQERGKENVSNFVAWLKTEAERTSNDAAL